VWSAIRFNPDRDPRARKHQFVFPLKLSLELVRAAGEEFQAGATGSRQLTIRDDIIADDWTG
jgi:hypothetical protein